MFLDRPIVLVASGVLALGIACSGDPGGPQGGIDDGRGAAGPGGQGNAGPSGSQWSSACGARVSQPPAPTVPPYCPPIDEMMAWVVGPPECPDHVYPTLEDLACNGAQIARRTMTTGAVGVGLDLGELETHPEAEQYLGKPGDTRWVLGIQDALEADFPAELAVPVVSGLPPHMEFRGANGTLDWVAERDVFETSVRVYAAEILRQRSKGRPVMFNYSLGPHEPQPTSVEDVESLIETFMVPRTEYIARVAESVNAELLLPFAGEADILANAPAFRSLPSAERVAHVQHLVDRVRETARAHFSGQLVGASAWQYYPENDGFWSTAEMDQVSWQGFDLVSFTMLPVTVNRCSVEHTRGFFQAQLAKIAELAARDGFQWLVGELDIFTFGYLSDYTPERGCTADPREVFLPIWDETLAQLLAAPQRPVAASFMAGPSEWADDTALLGELATRMSSFSAALKQP